MGEIARLENKTELVIMQGDLSKLSAEERLSYVNAICEHSGLNPLTRPFDYVTFQGKMILYARKECGEQLRKIHGVSVTKLEKEIIDESYVVTTYGRDKTGKEDVATGVVILTGLKGVDRANAMMKAETKSKRRLTLSICGLGLPDESEIDDMKAAAVATEVNESAFDDEPRIKVIKGLIAKFAKLGVAEADILNKFKVDQALQLSDHEVQELKEIGADIVNKRITVADAFAAEKEF